MIRVFIVDDHPVVIEGIHALLRNEKDLEWAGHAMNADSCFGFFANHTADVVLMDINLPDTSGVELCSMLKAKYPDVMVLGLSTYNQGLFIRQMMERGASGYMLKNASREELILAIHTVHEGGTYFSGEAGEALKTYERNIKRTVPVLSRREKEILELIAEGYTNPQIAEKLFVSTYTVDTHRKNVLTKLDVKNTAMLIRYAIEHKLI